MVFWVFSTFTVFSVLVWFRKSFVNLRPDVKGFAYQITINILNSRKHFLEVAIVDTWTLSPAILKDKFWLVILILAYITTSVWKDRRVGPTPRCVSYISLNIPAGRIILGVPGRTLMLLCVTGSQHRTHGQEEKRQQKRATWWEAEQRVSAWPEGKSTLCAWLGVRSKLPFNFPSHTPFSRSWWGGWGGGGL